MAVTYTLDRKPAGRDLLPLYEAAGWLEPGEDAALLDRLAAGSRQFACAWDDDRLVGTMRALSDGVSDAYLLDLVVLPAYRHRGIGAELVRRLGAALRERGLGWIVLVGAPGTAAFYSHLGAPVLEGYTPYRLKGATG